MNDELNIFNQAVPEESELKKVEKHILKFEEVSSGIVSDKLQETRFLPDGSIIHTKTSIVAFGKDGYSTNPEFQLARCYRGHIVSWTSLRHCYSCGRALCPLDRKVYKGVFYCRYCYFKSLAKDFLFIILKLFLFPFYY